MSGTNLRLLFVCASLLVLRAALGPDLAAAAEPEFNILEKLKAESKIQNPRQKWFVGDVVEIAARLKNVSDREVFVPDWSEGDPWNYWDFDAYISGAPGACDGGEFVSADKGQTTILVPLKPGASSPPITWRLLLALPGEVEAFANCEAWFVFERENKDLGITADRTHRWVRSPGLVIKVEPVMSDAMAARYAQSRRAILDAKQPLEKRLATLSGIAKEGHYFAARFVHEIWKDTRDGAVKRNAVQRLAELLDDGIAYQYIPDVLQGLVDRSMPAETRLQILGTITRMHINDSQPFVSLPQNTSHLLSHAEREAVLGALKAVANDPDKALAAEAKKILAADRPKR